MKLSSSVPRRPRKRTPAAAPVAIPSFIPPYPPSGIERFQRWIDRLPGPFWLAYLLLGLLLLLLQSAVHWSVGAYPIGTWNALHAMLSALIPGGLLLIHALDRLAERSFDAFRPVVSGGVAEAMTLRYQITTLPRRTTFAAFLGFIAFGAVVFLTPTGRTAGLATALQLLSSLDLSLAPAPLAFNLFLLILTWGFTGVFVYHTIHQLRWVSRIYARHTRVDLLTPGPLYSLSRVSAGTAVGLIVLVYLILAADRAFFDDPRNLAGAAAFGLLAAAAFVVPLLGIHRILAAEKGRLLDESANRLKAALAELHHRVDQKDLRRMDDLNKAIASLEVERALLGRIPTWPWQPETLRTFIGALLLPLILWLAQALLGRILPS